MFDWGHRYTETSKLEHTLICNIKRRILVRDIKLNLKRAIYNTVDQQRKYQEICAFFDIWDAQREAHMAPGYYFSASECGNSTWGNGPGQQCRLHSAITDQSSTLSTASSTAQPSKVIQKAAIMVMFFLSPGCDCGSSALAYAGNSKNCQRPQSEGGELFPFI